MTTTAEPGANPTLTAPRPVVLADDSRRILLAAARDTLEDAVRTGRSGVPPMPRDLPPELTVASDAFVTLTEAGELRGCMGVLGADLPLWIAVASAAASAALRDPRFRPVAPDELSRLHLDVSVLGPPAALVDVAGFRPGTDGIVVERGGRRALLLPEVATDAGWGAREMLDAVCRKAGLPSGSWQEAGTRLFVFRTLRFGGPVLAPVEVGAV